MLVDDKQAREREFEEWFLYNYPPGCILSNPSWHVGKIYRAATSSLSAQVAELQAKLRKYEEQSLCPRTINQG